MSAGDETSVINLHGPDHDCADAVSAGSGNTCGADLTPHGGGNNYPGGEGDFSFYHVLRKEEILISVGSLWAVLEIALTGKTYVLPGNHFDILRSLSSK